VGLAALPAVEISALLAFFFGRTLLDHTPGFINDAIDYWLEGQAFAHAGFHAGYFTIDERPAPASFSHFGSHGPFFPMLHGTLGRLLGWHPYSIPFFHLGFLTAALLFFTRRTSLDRQGRVLIVLGLATFWPLHFLLPTSLQEGLHLAVAVVLATMLRPLLEGREPSAAVRVVLPAVLIAACLVRPSWGLLLPPVFVLLLGAGSRRNQILAAAVGVVLCIALVLTFDHTAAPFGRHGFFFVKVARLQEGAATLADRVLVNALGFVEGGTALEVRNRFLVLGLALASGALAARAGARREHAFHAYNLGSILLATLLTYVFGSWADYRVLAAPLLLTALLLASSRAVAARRVAAFVVLAQLASVGPFIAAFPSLRETYRYDTARIETFGASARRALVFDGRQDAWCNTLVSVNFPYFYPEMVALPAGIGVTMLFGPPGATRLRSRYVLLDPEDLRRWTLGRPTVAGAGPDRISVSVGNWLSLRLRPLPPTPVGQLYENLDAHCPGG
jgi:hypothetical protein